MQIGKNNFGMQFNMNTRIGLNQNKPIAQGNVVSKVISDVQNMIPKQVDTTSADHIRKIYALNNTYNNDVEKKEDTEETKTSTDLPEVNITQETGERYEENVYRVLKQAQAGSNEMNSMYEYLTIAEKYEEYANTDGISDEAREKANAIASNIKNYVADILTTGGDIYQHMHKSDDEIFANYEKAFADGTIDEYRNGSGNEKVFGDKMQAVDNAISLTQDLLSKAGIDVSAQDIFMKTTNSLSFNNGIPKDREEFDKISTKDMKELLLNAKDYYDDVANKVKNLYIAEFNPNNEKSHLLENKYNPTANSFSNALATDLMTHNGATFEGQMKNNLQSIELVLCTGENNSQQTVITKLVEIENVDVDVKLEDVGEDMREHFLQNEKDTEILKQVLGDYYVN